MPDLIELLAASQAEVARLSRRLGEAEGILRVMGNSYDLAPSYYVTTIRDFFREGDAPCNTNDPNSLINRCQSAGQYPTESGRVSPYKVE